MQHSNKSNPSDSGNDDDLTYFEALLSYYRSIGWVPSLFRRRNTTTFEKAIEHKNKTAKFLNKIKSMQVASYGVNLSINKEIP